MKRLMKVFSGGSAMRRKGRMIGQLIGSMQQCAGSRSVGRPQKKWMDTVKDY